MGEFFRRLQAIDRRWIYLALSAGLIISLLLGKPVTPVVIPPVQQLYDTVNRAPSAPQDGKLILIGMTFSSSTLGESGNQARALLRHLMLTHKRFAIIAISEPQGATLGNAIATELAKQYGYTYGVDWIDFGYQIGTLAFYKSFPKDVPGTVGVDGVEGKPVGTFPIMAKVRTINDIAMHIEVTASASVFDWIQIVQPRTDPRLQIGYACTGVMATEAYPLLDSGQMIGMLPGLKGAADYERLVDELEARTIAAGKIKSTVPADLSDIQLYRSARTLMFTQGIAHLIIIAFIILGNLGMLLARRQTPPLAKETTNG